MVMVRGAPFTLVYDRKVKLHLKSIDPRHHSQIRRSIEDQLTFQPEVQTRNRKPLIRESELDADWELRIGTDNRFRVFYTVDHERHEVQILAIGVKKGNRLFIGGEEIVL
ncbi:MAG TPA: type II toxin-antitoxin system RelE/ParE family toxin [Tepidisphaeraceae bacterium]|jgi:mRNA-degrading endonuclease RelE of RelBE toxin-antitoxin system|nr:type II toxin-antitoxin system RelE/ParE family toxin [Tepidisphaeraceae bacterium]